MIQTIIASSQIEAGCDSIAFVKGFPRSIVEGPVPLLPFSIEPYAALACIEMSEYLLVISRPDMVVHPLGNQVYCRLVDDLVLDAEERVRAKDTGFLGYEELAGMARLEPSAPNILGKALKQRFTCCSVNGI